MSFSIPTDSADDALAFCKQLAELMQQVKSSAPAIHAPLPAAKEVCPAISVVVPVYNEEENLETLYQRLCLAIETSGESFECIFVNDGSSDRSQSILQELAARDSRVSVLELARNFGHQTALSAGLDFARGEGIVLIDADLQDTPESIPMFIQRWREGYEVVYAIRTERKENWIKRSGYRCFYRLLQQVAKVDIPLDAGDFCIMDRKVVDILNAMPERNRFIRGIRSWVGFKQLGVPVERHARNAGCAKYSYSDLVFLALDGLVSFSFVPLRIISMVGISVSLFSVFIAMFYAVKKIFYGLYPPGFATLVVLISFFAGTQLVTIGVIGEYIGRIFDEVKRRPLYIVERFSGSRFE